MKLLQRLLCWWGCHELPPGVSHEFSVVWCCRACRALVPGGMRRR